MNKIHVLIVDDDRQICELVAGYLRTQDVKTSIAANGAQMAAVLADQLVDLIVLDLMLPGEDGLSLFRRLRAGTLQGAPSVTACAQTPVIILTARDDDVDRIIGLEAGADDYLTKPFVPRELLARIRSVLRRSRMLPPGFERPESVAILAFGVWRLDTVQRYLVDSAGVSYALSGAEFALLRIFLDHPKHVLNRDQLLSLLAGRDAGAFDRSIDLRVSRLRRRLRDDARDPAYINTVRNEGYGFAKAVSGAASPALAQ